MSDPRFLQDGFDKRLSHVIEECGGDSRKLLASLLHPTETRRDDADLALQEATSLAISLFNRHYRQDEHYSRADSPVVWEPLPDIRGVISQIDNMTTGLTRRDDAGGEVWLNDKAVMPCPVCEGEGEIADGMDEAACSMLCPRCDGNAWLVDLAALRTGEPK